MAKRRDSHPRSSAALSESFQRFAETECRGMSPLYYRLSLGIAADQDLLALADHAKRGQPRPNLFLAAVQRLLMDEPDHPLAAFYPHISGAVRRRRQTLQLTTQCPPSGLFAWTISRP